MSNKKTTRGLMVMKKLTDEECKKLLLKGLKGRYGDDSDDFAYYPDIVTEDVYKFKYENSEGLHCILEVDRTTGDVFETGGI